MTILFVAQHSKVGKIMVSAPAADLKAIVWVSSTLVADKFLTNVIFDAVIYDRTAFGAEGSEPVLRWRRTGFSGPILVLCDTQITAERLEAIERGADDYLDGAVKLPELLVRIEDRLRESPSTFPRFVRDAEIMMDRRKGQIVVRGHPIAMGQREFELLECFRLAPNRILTRSELCNKIWGQWNDRTESLLEVYMYKLRHKLAAIVGRKLFSTVRGSGYLFSDVGEDTEWKIVSTAALTVDI